jgi:biotin synthase
MAGANSIFYGEKLLTTENNDADEDRRMIEALGLRIVEKTEGQMQACEGDAKRKS